MSDMVMVKSTEVLAAEINAIKEQTRATVMSGAIQIGQRLLEAKEQVPHGQWGEWLEEHVDYSERTAQNLMRVYEEYGKKPNPQALADLSYTKAVQLLGLPWDLREQLLEDADVEGMSTRELQDQIRRLQEENQQKQATIDDLLDTVDQSSDIMRLEDQLTASQSTVDEIREALEVEKGRAKVALEAMDALRGELEKKATADAKLEQRAKDAEAKAKEAVKRANELQAQLQEAEAKVVTERVEVPVIPLETQAELEQLRGIAARAPSEPVVRLRAGYERLLAEFQSVHGLLAALRAVDAEEATKYARAVTTAMHKMIEEVNAGEQ